MRAGSSPLRWDDNERPVFFVLPHDREGLELVDDFDAMGQRLTASGTTNLNNAIVYPDEIQTLAFDETKRSIVTPYAQLYLGAVEAGIARNVLDDAVAFARDRARPIKHSTASRSVDDPYVEHAVGEISARAFAAEAVILRAADSIDAAWGAGLDEPSVTRAAVDVAQAQFIAIESAAQGGRIAVRRRRCVHHQTRIQPRSSLAQCPNRGQSQSARLEGRGGRGVPTERHRTAAIGIVLRSCS